MTTITLNGISYPDTDFEGYGYKTTTTGSDGVSRPRWQNVWVDGKADVAASVAAAGTAETGAAASASAAAASAVEADGYADAAAASYSAMVALGAGAYSFGTGTFSLPRNFDLGSAAYLDWRDLPTRIHPRTLTGTTTLTPHDGGRLILSAGYAVTLPSAGDPDLSMSPGWSVLIKATSGTVTVTRSGSDTIDGGTAVTVGVGSTVRIVRASSTSWHVQVMDKATGTHTIGFLASGLTPRTTDGPTYGTVAGATNSGMVEYLEFADGTAKYANRRLGMAKGWNHSAGLTFRVRGGTEPGGSTGACVFKARAVAVGDGDTLDAAWGTAVAVTLTIGAAGAEEWSAVSGTVTIAGSPAQADSLWIEVYRDPADASDTLAATVRLYELEVFAQFNSATDD